MPGSRANQVLVIVLVVLVVGLLVYMRLDNRKGVDRTRLDGSSYSQETLNKTAVINLTNEAREANGLPALCENQLLNEVAEARAVDMLEKQYFAHVSPTGEQASDVAQRVGYHYKIIAENIASGTFLTNRKIVDGWMQSPGHRTNIVSPDVREIGVAVVKGQMKGSDAYVSVQIFGLESPPVSRKACTLPPAELYSEIETKKREINSLNETLNRVKGELESERDSIESGKRSGGGSPNEVYNLNVKIKAHNEKSEWHNKVLAELSAKTLVVQSLIDEYNRSLQEYKECQASE